MALDYRYGSYIRVKFGCEIEKMITYFYVE